MQSCFYLTLRIFDYVRNISISGAALDVSNPLDIPERFNLVFKADGTHIPCHVIWRQADQIGVAFD